MTGGREVAPGVHRLGSGRVNFYAIVADGAVALVDAGLPGHHNQLPALLGEVGLAREQVTAVVLTHAHVDHLGIAEEVRAGVGATVLAHSRDVGADRRARRFPPLHLYWRPSSWPWLAETMRAGLLGTPAVGPIEAYGDGTPLDVPGRPVAVHTPGHTPGSCALHLRDRGVVLSGDALVTLDPYTGATGPRLLLDGVNDDTAEARRSLARLADLDADVVLPGHGEPWHGAPRDAVAAALG